MSFKLGEKVISNYGACKGFVEKEKDAQGCVTVRPETGGPVERWHEDNLKRVETLAYPNLPKTLDKGDAVKVARTTTFFHTKGTVLNLKKDWRQNETDADPMSFTNENAGYGAISIPENYKALEFEKSAAAPVEAKLTAFAKGEFVKVAKTSMSWCEAEVGNICEVLTDWAGGTTALELKLPNGSKAWVHNGSGCIDALRLLSKEEKDLELRRRAVEAHVKATKIKVGDFVRLKKPGGPGPDWPSSVITSKSRVFRVSAIGPSGKLYVDVLEHAEKLLANKAHDGTYKQWLLGDSELLERATDSEYRQSLKDSQEARILANAKFKIGDEFIIDPNHEDLKHDHNRGKRYVVTGNLKRSWGNDFKYEGKLVDPNDIGTSSRQVNTKEEWMLPAPPRPRIAAATPVPTPVAVPKPVIYNTESTHNIEDFKIGDQVRILNLNTTQSCVGKVATVDRITGGRYINTSIEGKPHMLLAQEVVMHKALPTVAPTPAKAELLAAPKPVEKPKERIIIVKSVGSGSPAEKAGLRSGDTVVEFGGEIVSKSDKTIKDIVQGSKESLTVVLARGNDRLRKIIHQNFDPEGDLWRNGALFEISETDKGAAKWCENHPDRRGMEFMMAMGHCFCADCKEEFTEDRYAKATEAAEMAEARATTAEAALRFANRAKWLKRAAVLTFIVGGAGAGAGAAYFKDVLLTLLYGYLGK